MKKTSLTSPEGRALRVRAYALSLEDRSKYEVSKIMGISDPTVTRWIAEAIGDPAIMAEAKKYLADRKEAAQEANETIIGALDDDEAKWAQALVEGASDVGIEARFSLAGGSGKNFRALMIKAGLVIPEMGVKRRIRNVTAAQIAARTANLNGAHRKKA